ncbi:PIN domain-containing protein [Gordonia oryzae]|uniref:Ribonuclease VapC n=1 Tax=Gordonia oryzae TaxID=2487349 RepID=A0A3N4G6U4_9ACTN|nr:PIN domain-containing protein [Gordonia oryzae]RPA58503.1 PIN domain-containing protein [Gordonia oryzae]
MILDTSALLAYFDSAEPQHSAAAEIIESHPGPLVISPFVIAELDYLLLTRHGTRAEQVVLSELTSGAWELASMTRSRIVTATAIVERYSDIPIGVTDASNIVLADAYQTSLIATLDHRHFSILRLMDGSPPTIVP